MWTNDLCRELIREGYSGRQPVVLFGGPHSSLPSFQRMTVRAGDTVYPIRAYQSRLHALCAVRVERVIPLKEAEEHLTEQQRAWDIRIHASGDQQPLDNLAIREALRSDQLLAHDYAKINLAHAHDNPEGHDAYQAAKDRFLGTLLTMPRSQAPD